MPNIPIPTPSQTPTQVVTSAQQSDSFLLPMIILGVFIFVIWYFLKGRKPKEYKVPQLAELNIKDFKYKLGRQGIKIGGFWSSAKLHIGFHEVAKIDKYLIIRGIMQNLKFDEKTFGIVKDEAANKVLYDFIIIRAKNPSAIWRLLGLKKEFYLLTLSKDDKGADNIQIDYQKKRIFIHDKVDIRSFGGLWVNSTLSLAYIEELSISRLLQSAEAIWEDFPNRLIHLEMQASKRERLSRVEANIERNKYEQRKDVGDSSIT